MKRDRLEASKITKAVQQEKLNQLSVDEDAKIDVQMAEWEEEVKQEFKD